MKNRERYDQVQSVVDKFHDVIGDLIGMAEVLEIEDYESLAERARYVVGQIEQLSHDIFQKNLKDNA